MQSHFLFSSNIRSMSILSSSFSYFLKSPIKIESLSYTFFNETFTESTIFSNASHIFSIKSCTFINISKYAIQSSVPIQIISTLFESCYGCINHVNDNITIDSSKFYNCINSSLIQVQSRDTVSMTNTNFTENSCSGISLTSQDLIFRYCEIFQNNFTDYMLRLSYCTTFISYSMFHSESNFSQYAISIGSQSIASFNVSIFHLPINVYSVFVESGSAVLNYCCFDKNETEEIDGNNVVCVNCSFGQKCENTFSIWWLEPEEDRSKRVITEFVYLILLALGAVVLLIAVIVAVKKNKVERNSNFEQLVDFQTE